MGTAVPFMVANIASFLGMSFWGWTADKIGRRWAMMIPATIAVPIAPDLPVHLRSVVDHDRVRPARRLRRCTVQPVAELSVGAVPDRSARDGQAPSVITSGAIFGGFVAPVLAYFRGQLQSGLRHPDAVRDGSGGGFSVVIALSLSPETKGKVLVAELSVALNSSPRLVRWAGRNV